MQLPLPNGSYKHPSKPTDYQLCINYFPTSPGPDGRGRVTLLPTMGSKLVSSGGGGQVRFIKEINGMIYIVIGNIFYSATVDIPNETVSLTTLGVLNTLTGTVIGTSNPTQIILLDGQYGYIYNFSFSGTVPLGQIGGTAGDTYNLTINSHSIYSGLNVATALSPLTLVAAINAAAGTTGVTASYVNGLLTLIGDTGSISSITVTESGTGFTAGVDGISVSPGVFSTALPYSQFGQISDSDFVAGSHVVYIDGYFIVNNSGTQKFQFSQPNEGRIWNGLDVASAESKPDLLISLGNYKGELWLFGTNSIEVWFDNANPTGSPFSKRVGSDINIGCSARYSVTEINDTLVWLDSRKFIVQSDVSNLFREQSTGYTLTKISDEALEYEISTYDYTDDAIGSTYVDRGHIMYEITFPTIKKTWVYDYNTKVWHERNKINPTTNQLEHSLVQYCDSYGGVIIGGGVRDNKLYFLLPDYYYDNTDLIHRIFTTPHATADFKLIGLDEIELKMMTGEMDSYPSDPVEIILQFSNDNGYTWSYELFRPIGSVGDYLKRLIWNIRGTAYQWILKFKFTAPVKHAIVDLSANTNIENT